MDHDHKVGWFNSLSTRTFHSMAIGPPIPGIQLLKNFKLKIEDQSHG